MSTQTNISFRNENDPEFRKVKNGSKGEIEEWESLYGPIEDFNGTDIEGHDDAIRVTDDEYGGWLIAVKDIPKNATHIAITRS